MGGAERVLAKAQDDFAAGEFRIVAEVLNHLVFAEPGNEAARLLLADTYEQLGYASESATWRNAYLFGAQELRQGMPKVPNRSPISNDTVRALHTGQLFEYLGVRLNGPNAEGKTIVLNWEFTDSGERFVLNLENCALTHMSGHASDANATLTLDRKAFNELVLQTSTMSEAVEAGKVCATGDASRFDELMTLMDDFERMFEIVEPRRQQPVSRGGPL
jgi:alkyl sulfatase BDS1-like metallo-beta-lactamase superfamily hydrolase